MATHPNPVAAVMFAAQVVDMTSLGAWDTYCHVSRPWHGANVAFLSFHLLRSKILAPMEFRMASLLARTILLIVVFLATPAGMVAMAQSVPKANSTVSTLRPSTGQWRRTSKGWERSSNWPTKDDRSRSMTRVGKVHPLVLATFISLVSLGGLIGFGPSRSKSR